MRHLYQFLFLLALWTTAESCRVHGSAANGKLKAELEDILTRVVSAANRGDVEEFASFHTADCELNFHRAEPVQCKEGIKLETKDANSLVLEGIDFIKVLSDNTVYSPVSVNSVDSAGNTVVRFRIIILWRMKDKWLIERRFVNYKEIPPQAQAQADIEAQMVALYDAFTRDDLDAILKLYVDDGDFLFHGLENIKGIKDGTEGIKLFLPGLKTVFLVEVTFFELFNDDVAYTTADLIHVDENGRTFAGFRDDLMWRKVDGIWLIQVDAFNDVPLNCKC